MDPLELLKRRDAGEYPPGAGPRLKLAVNSCRRARWDARLGFFWPRHRAGRMLGKGRGGDGGGGEEHGALEVPLCTVVPGEERFVFYLVFVWVIFFGATGGGQDLLAVLHAAS